MLKKFQIEGLEQFENIDYENGDLLFRILQKRKYFVSKPKAELIQMLPSFDHFAFRIEQRTIATRGSENNRIFWEALWHQAMHVLINCRFGDELKGRPGITLLNECFGLSLDIYLTAHLARLSEKKAWPWITRHYEKSKVSLRRSYKRRFQDAVNDPFKAYQKSVLAAFAIHWEVYQLWIRGKKNKSLQLAKAVQLIRRYPDLSFFFDSDFSTPTLYVATYCGTRSNSSDVRDLNAALRDRKSVV